MFTFLAYRHYFPNEKLNMEVLSIFDKQIKALRRWYRISQEDLGELVGVTRQAVAKWEKGEAVPDIITMKKLADWYKISLDELVDFHIKEEKTRAEVKERYFFGKVTVETGGKIKLSKEIRENMNIKPGDDLLVLGDLERGIEFLPPNCYWERLLK